MVAVLPRFIAPVVSESVIRSLSGHQNQPMYQLRPLFEINLRESSINDDSWLIVLAERYIRYIDMQLYSTFRLIGINSAKLTHISEINSSENRNNI